MVNHICVLVSLALLLVGVSARPRYIVIPLDDVEVVAGGWRRSGGTRVARHAWAGDAADQNSEQDGRVERQAHGHHQHVDYGAHTGHHGAFGWYADFPVKTDH